MDKQIIIDADKCTGCKLCEMACSLEKEGECGTVYSRIKVIKMHNGVNMPILCLQCEDAVCAKVCPVHAIVRDSNGALVIDYALCIGCKVCFAVCPFGAISLHPRHKKVIKCDLCDGKPVCVNYCQPKALSFERKDRADLIKKRRVAQTIYVTSHKGKVAKGSLKV
ncbi:MAG: 4Fe-4S dicluster domain-containing protein [Candidatus Bathyarchaeia archaeon]